MKSATSFQCACVLLLAFHTEAFFVSRDSGEIRQPGHEFSAKTLQPGHAEKTTPKDDKKETAAPVVRAENALREHTEKHSANVMSTIDKFRASICYRMKVEHGMEFATFGACKKFMENTCKPGRDMDMDGERQEVPSGKGYCKEYFDDAEEAGRAAAAKEEGDEHEHEEDLEKEMENLPAPAPAPSSPASPASEKIVKSEKDKDKAPAPAPAAAKEKESAAAAPAAAKGSASGPAAGPAAGPASAPGGASPAAPPGKDEAYYYKNGGKDKSRMHMSEDMKLPTQGYWGKLVEHDDGETMTDDWMTEFGPNAHHDSVAKICREHPHSAWCKRGSVRDKFNLRSSCTTPFTHILTAAIALLIPFVF